MKKKMLIVTSLMFIGMFFSLLLNSSAFASSPATLSSTINNQVEQGGTVTLTTNLTYGNVLQCIGEESPCSIRGLHFDSSKFDFVSFVSDYLKYDGNTQTFDPTDITSGTYVMPVYVNTGESPVKLWTLTLKVRSDAKIGETTVYTEKVNISAAVVAEDTKKDATVDSSESKSAATTDTKDESSSANIFLYSTIGLGALVVILAICLIATSIKHSKKSSTIVEQPVVTNDISNLNQ